MATGTVKSLRLKGLRLHQQDGGGPDVFAHYSNIASSGFRELLEGQKVSFDVAQGQRAGGERHPRLISGTRFSRAGARTFGVRVPARAVSACTLRALCAVRRGPRKEIQIQHDSIRTSRP